MILDLVFSPVLFPFCLSLVAFSFAFSLFFSSSLLAKPQCCICFSLIYFHSETLFGCQPTLYFLWGRQVLLVMCNVAVFWSWKSHTESIFSQHFFQLIWVEMFLPHISFRKGRQASSASGTQQDLEIGSSFPVQACTNLIC